MSRGKALVTGAGKRLGREMALYLAQAGYDVAVHYASSEKDARQVASEIEKTGSRAALLQADLLVEADMQSLMTRARDALGGPVTLLVNNASIFEPDDLETGTRESWDRHLESNLRAPFVLTQSFAAQPDLPARGALIVNMIDQRVRKLTPQYMSYTLAKSALWTLTQTAAQALAPKIRVNAIGPGPTLRNERQSEAEFDAQQNATLLQTGASPSDLCQTLGYLIDAGAVTGQMLCVDGGQHLAWQTPDVIAGD